MNKRAAYHNINKKSPIPAYHQIYTDLRTRILNGEWAEGDKLPSENDLVSLYSASRVTVRQALTALEQDGLIEKMKGRGSLVQKRPPAILHDFSLPSTLCAKLGQKGISLDAKIIRLEVVPPSAHINGQLKLRPEQSIVYIQRLFLHSGRPIALNESWISEDFLPGIVDDSLIDGHLSMTLAQKYNLVPVRIENSLEATVATTIEVMDLLHIQYGTPLIIVTSLSFLPYDVPLEFSRTHWLGDRVKFHFNMD